MKTIKLIFILFLVITYDSLAQEQKYPLIMESYIVRIDGIQLYKSPKDDAKKEGALAIGDQVMVIKQVSPTYYQVKMLGKDYYLPSTSISPDTTKKNNIIIGGSSSSSSSAPSFPSSHTIHTGSRGGQYYINKNGNKTYIKK